MSRIVLVVGGARSGKSAYALILAQRYKKVAFLATCQGLDREMRARIKLHQLARPRHWITLEAPFEAAKAIGALEESCECIVIDCLTLLVSNLMMAGKKEKEILRSVDALLEAVGKKKARTILVSNEVGLGIVPDNKLAREYRDIAGRVNQRVAKCAHDVYFMVSGIALKIK